MSMRLILTIFAVALLGCSGKTKTDVTQEKRTLRVADVAILAADLTERDSPNWNKTREPLKKIVWNRGLSAEIRLAAFDALLAHDEADTVAMLGYLLPSETDWVVLEAFMLDAQSRQWTQLRAAIVRSLRREVPEPALEDRPEYLALLALSPGKTIEEIVYSVFADTTLTGELGQRARQDAWSMLLKLDPDRAHVQQLLASTGETSDELLGNLIAAAQDLSSVPSTPEQIRWLRQLRQPGHSQFWDQATAALARVPASVREEMQLAFLAPLVYAEVTSSEIVGASRQTLLDTMRERLSSRRIMERRTGDTFDHPERLATWEEVLTWGELLSLVVIDDALHQDALMRELFTQAQEDRADKSTEYGGLLLRDPANDSLRVQRYIPRPTQRRGDTTYIAPPEMMLAATEALVFYHFHANGVQNRLRAGPSEADKTFSAESGRVCMVVSTLQRGRLDVDVYFPSGAVVDLGVFELPR
jgi:hypothetical protein